MSETNYKDTGLVKASRSQYLSIQENVMQDYLEELLEDPEDALFLDDDFDGIDDYCDL